MFQQNTKILITNWKPIGGNNKFFLSKDPERGRYKVFPGANDGAVWTGQKEQGAGTRSGGSE